MESIMTAPLLTERAQGIAADTGPGYRAGSTFRLYMGGIAISTWFLAMYEPRSMVGLVAASQAGRVLAWCLLTIGIAVFIDAFVNDFLPERFHWKAAMRQRHFLLCSLAFCYVSQLYVVYSSLQSHVLMAYYLWNAFTIMLINFVDAQQRAKDALCLITCN